jgi:hypothetical protein
MVRETEIVREMEMVKEMRETEISDKFNYSRPERVW